MRPIVYRPRLDSYATLLRKDRLWESTYSILSLQSSHDVNVACFDGSDSERLTISVVKGK